MGSPVFCERLLHRCSSGICHRHELDAGTYIELLVGLPEAAGWLYWCPSFLGPARLSLQVHLEAFLRRQCCLVQVQLLLVAFDVFV